ncbi:MAG: VCBS repeat-containing protein [Deltaproteobacteria bacterium]|nr:VCBS repeat-containing protein [Deltaproteobacteria bacterium]
MYRGSVPCLLALVLFLPPVATGCSGSEEGPSDPGNPFENPTQEDIIDDSGTLESPTCKISAPHEDKIMSEMLPDSKIVKFTVDDPEGMKISRVALAFLVDGTPVTVFDETQITDNAITTSVDTSGVADGKRQFVCKVETEDDRTGTQIVTVTVDNEPPTITLVGGSTLPDSNFLGNLVIRFLVSDGLGVGTDTVDIRVNGNPKVGPPAPVQEDKPHTVEIPSLELTNGKITVQMEATDAIGNKMANPLEYNATFTAPPEFLAGLSASFPEGFAPGTIRGLILGSQWTVVAGGLQGVRLYTLGTGEVLEDALVVTDKPVALVRVADVDGDGTDDIVTAGAEEQGKSTVRIYLQVSGAEGPEFENVWDSTVDNIANDMTLGHLNEDAYLDLALALETTSASMGLALSKESGGPNWDPFKLYGGVQRPHLIGIGDFTGESPPENDILVAKPGSGLVTVFPVNAESGTPAAGVNSQVGIAADEPFDSLSALVTGAWGSPNDPILAVFTDETTAHLIEIEPSDSGLGKVANTQPDTTGLTPKRIVVGDMDRDGRDDLAVLCPGSHMVMLFWGQPEGASPAFKKGPVSLMTGSAATDLTLADLVGVNDAEPYLDVVVLAGNKLLVIPFDDDPDSLGFRRFQGPLLVSLGVKPKAMAAGSFTRPDEQLSGFKDLAVLAEVTLESRIFFFVSDREQKFPTASLGNPLNGHVKQPVGMVSRDLDKNDYDDLVIATRSSSPPAVDPPEPTVGLIFLEDGGSHFSPKQVGTLAGTGLFAGNSPEVLTVEDLKRDDSNPDVMDLGVISQFYNESTDEKEIRFQVYSGAGNGSFTKLDTANQIPDERRPSSVTAAKLRGLKNYDVVMANSLTDDITVYFSGILGTFTEEETYAVGSDPQAVVAAFMEDPADTKPDIVTLLKSDVAIMYSKDSIELSYDPIKYLGHTGDPPSAMAVKDMNLDGYPDILLLSKQASTVTVYLNLANRQYSAPYVFSTGYSPLILVVDDLDNDGCMDIATADEGGETITLLRNLLCQNK